MSQIDRGFFDAAIETRGRCSTKWDSYREDLLPMWVADMDFATVPAVTQALAERAAHPVYGYAQSEGRHVRALLGWWERRHGLRLGEDQVTDFPGVVSGLRVAIRALSKPGDEIVIQPPVYGPFYSVVRDSDRHLVCSPLRREEEGWRMDYEDLERKFRAGARLMILCSPHNPIGRVWTRAELERLLSLCQRYDVRILSDEIHADLCYPGHRHVPLLSMEGAGERTLAFVAPSKTFNIAGLCQAAMLATNPALQKAVEREKHETGVEAGNLFGLIAMQTAFEQGEPWLCALLPYLDDSRKRLSAFLRSELPEVGFRQVEGTYLMLLDLRAFGQDDETLRQKLERPGGIALSGGSFFGAPGWMRINFACPHARLEEGLVRLRKFLTE